LLIAERDAGKGKGDPIKSHLEHPEQLSEFMCSATSYSTRYSSTIVADNGVKERINDKDITRFENSLSVI
jgi:hypothetical protein